ncbi:chitosanase [Lapidilactobacillus achengensis]|uniref:Chitosanase n=1 Tax=Lapidilactobacillus achengensis TaxID=2486000 RepID=A0ABW1UPP8_9LACO|nr:chitosanase [Lapidilactobacillus achengensis]
MSKIRRLKWALLVLVSGGWLLGLSGCGAPTKMATDTDQSATDRSGTNRSRQRQAQADRSSQSRSGTDRSSQAQASADPTTPPTIASGRLRKITFALVASAENSTTAYQSAYRYIEDIGDGRGYTAGIIGFTSGTGDLLQVVQRYQKLAPKNKLTQYLPALRRVNGTASHRGLGKSFVRAWHQASQDPKMIQAQNTIVRQEYLDPAVSYAQRDGLSPLGQYLYYDALVVHGPGTKAEADSFQGIRAAALKKAPTPAQGGKQATYLKAFLAARQPIMLAETAHQDLSRLQVQRQLINAGNFQLKLPLQWRMYGDQYHLTAAMVKQLP